MAKLTNDRLVHYYDAERHQVLCGSTVSTTSCTIPSSSSAPYEWDMVGTARSWKRAHNATHHVFTNVIGPPYETGSLASQFASAMRRLVRFAGPGARTSWRGRRPGVTARAARSACEPVLGDGSSGARREGPASRGGSRQRATPTARHSGAAVGAVTPS